MTGKAEKQEDRFRAYIIPSVVGVLMLVMYFLQEKDVALKDSLANLFADRDAENQKKIEYWKGESFYWRDRYFNRIEAGIDKCE